MEWWEISLQAPPERADAIAAALGPYAYGGVAMEPALETEPGSEDFMVSAERPVRITVYLAQDASFPRRRTQLLDVLHAVAPGVSPHESEVRQTDWEAGWRDHFRVARIGRRLVVKPTWRRYRQRPGDVVVEIDPGMAFGTGDHPTTRACLRALELHLEPGARVLDLGTGSGILAMAAAKLGASAVLALDIDLVAVESAIANCRLNGVENTVDVVHGSLDSPRAAAWGTADVTLANLTSRLHCELAAAIVAHTKPGGWVIGAGIGSQGLRPVLAAYQAAGAGKTLVRRAGEWRAVVWQREQR